MGASLQPGTHACCQFTSLDDKRSVIGAFVTEGVARGERVAVYSRDGSTALVDAAVGTVGRRELEKSRQLVVRSGEETYFAGGSFDRAARVEGFAAFVEQTVAEGFPGLRVYADNGWMPGTLPDPTEWLTYELQVGAMIRRYPLIGLCGFDPGDDVLSADAVDAVHAVNLSEEKPSVAFRVEPYRDGFAFVGEIDRLLYPQTRRLLDAAAPLLRGASLHLTGVSFVDASSAAMLYDYLLDVRPTITGVSPALSRMWQLLGLPESGSPAA